MNLKRSIKLITAVLAATRYLGRRMRRRTRLLCLTAALTTSGCIDDANIECVRNPELAKLPPKTAMAMVIQLERIATITMPRDGR